MKLFVVLIIILIFLFLPLPIKIKIDYINNNLTLKIYKFTFFSSKKGIENKYLKKVIKKEKLKKEKLKEEGNLKDNKHISRSKNKKSISFKKLYRNITKNKFKPKIKINGSLTYGIDDAALCAILYGLICNIPNLIFFILNAIFKVKNLIFDINPKFNTSILSFSITSIFYFNIANIIYMLFLLFKSKDFKEVDPK